MDLGGNHRTKCAIIYSYTKLNYQRAPTDIERCKASLTFCWPIVATEASHTGSFVTPSFKKITCWSLISYPLSFNTCNPIFWGGHPHLQMALSNLQKKSLEDVPPTYHHGGMVWKFDPNLGLVSWGMRPFPRHIGAILSNFSRGFRSLELDGCLIEVNLQKSKP